ncbi:MAG TPA: hypothetical protein VJ697_16900 [Nitrososphaeraceae archaeon]|nr:hypothetical protein [Nitrososphaeraceae archaeon]
MPYNGVKGKGSVTIIDDPNRTVLENKFEIPQFTIAPNSKNDN